MSQEEKHNKINHIIDSLASSNPHLTESQIKKAKNLYRYDTRPIEEIEKELTDYSQSVKEYHDDAGIVAEYDPVNTMESDLQNLYSTDANGEPVVEGNRGQVTYPEQPTHPEPDPTDELDSMFENNTTEKDFAQIDTLGEKPKVFQLKFPSFDGEHGYSNMEVLLTIASLLSIMGIVISAFIIYFK